MVARFRSDADCMLRFIILFMLFLMVMFTAELTPPVEQYVIHPFTSLLANACVWLITLFDGDVVASGNTIRSASNGFAISIERGCNGIEAIVILISAVLAFPSPWKNKLAGIGIGFFAIQLLNVVRIISLYYMGQWSRLWFDWFHLYLWQALIILDALIVFLVWLRYLPPPEDRRDPPSLQTANG